MIKNFIFRRWQKLRDYLRVALTVAVVFALGLLIVPFVQLIPAPVFMVVGVAPLYSMAAYVMMHKVSLRMPMLFFGALLGLVLTVFMPYMFFVSFTSALLVEALGAAISRLGAAALSVSLRAIFFPVFQFPIMYYLVMPWEMNASLLTVLFGVSLLVTATSYLGLLLGRAVLRRMAARH